MVNPSNNSFFNSYKAPLLLGAAVSLGYGLRDPIKGIEAIAYSLAGITTYAVINECVSNKINAIEGYKKTAVKAAMLAVSLYVGSVASTFAGIGTRVIDIAGQVIYGSLLLNKELFSRIGRIYF